jgi:hypothetical protein
MALDGTTHARSLGQVEQVVVDGYRHFSLVRWVTIGNIFHGSYEWMLSTVTSD